MNTATDLLSHHAYRTQIKLPKYNHAVTVFTAVSLSDAATVLRKLNPDWSHEDHAELAERHGTMAMQMEDRYRKTLDLAAQETFGRPFQFMDYKISTIGSDAFSEARKDELRTLARNREAHRTCELAHRKAAGRYSKNSKSLPNS